MQSEGGRSIGTNQAKLTSNWLQMSDCMSFQDSALSIGAQSGGVTRPMQSQMSIMSISSSLKPGVERALILLGHVTLRCVSLN